MPETKEVSQTDEELLKQIRSDFTYVREYWSEAHSEAEKDMDCVACIPPSDMQGDRKGRPLIWPDEISQYVNQCTNNLRQNKRSIKLSPRSDEAQDKDAEHRQAYIRGIEYASMAESIYSSAFENCVECSFGFFRVTTMVTGPKGEQEPRIRRIPNQFTAYADPDAKEADFSDSNLYFLLDTMRVSTFAKRYPKAKKKSFTGDDVAAAPGWLSGDNITVAEYWKRKEETSEDGEKTYKVTQYITNGFEILEKTEWIGSWIPIIGVFGHEKYVRSSGQSKRIFLSLVRRARAPQQMIAYLVSQEAEEFQMTPRAPLIGYKGQFDPDLHKLIHKVPMGYVETNIPTDWNMQWGPPPIPQRAQFTPNIQAYEVARESWRRAVQASMGIAPLPTAAQRQNEKSGIAIEKIQNQEAIGSFHFIDNFTRSLANCGRQLNELITKLAELDSLPKQVFAKDQKDEDMLLRVQPRDGQEQPQTFNEGIAADSQHLDEADQFFAHRGQFEVTISDGPSYQSQREEASAFADTLLQSLPAVGMPPQITQAVLAIAVKLKNIGTYGDEIADLLQPPDPNNLTPKEKAIQAQAQGQIQQLQAELQKLQMEKMAKVTEIQGKMALADKEGQFKMSEADKDRELKLAIAEISTKAQSLEERMKAVEEFWKQAHAQAHEAGMQAQDQAHQKDLAAQQAQAAQEQQAQGAVQQQIAAQSAPPQGASQ